MELHVVAIEQNNVKLYVGVMPAKMLTDTRSVEADYYSAEDDTGYQRNLSPARFKDFARYLKNSKGISPSSILLNIRGEVKGFKPITSSYGILTLPDNTKFWIVDGQHRIAGLKELIEQDASFSDFPCIVVLMTARSEYEEAKQFLILNKTQKGVKSDLAERFIARMVKREGIMELANMPKITVRDIEWMDRAIEIIDLLNKEFSDNPSEDFYNNPWHERINLPNAPRGKTIISQSAFAKSLKNLLDSPTFSGYGIAEISIILSRYWSAILDICPNAKIEPEKYVLQRTTGVAVLNRILPRVVAFATRGGQRLTKENIGKILRKMPDGLNEVFWSTDGVAGVIGTSQKAISILTKKVLDFLEAGNAEENKEMKKPFHL